MSQQYKCKIMVALLPYIRVENVLYRSQFGAHSNVRPRASLERVLQKARTEGAEVVFPSHFFEYPDHDLLTATAQTRNTQSLPNYSVQISPGDEFTQFTGLIEQWSREGLGLEIVFDRQLATSDLMHIRAWLQQGTALRLVFCPTRERDAGAILALLPSDLWPYLQIFFPPKWRAEDAFLSEDEAILQLDDLKNQFSSRDGDFGDFQFIVTHYLDADEEFLNLSVRPGLCHGHGHEHEHASARECAYASASASASKTSGFASRGIRWLAAGGHMRSLVLYPPFFILWLMRDPADFFIKTKNLLFNATYWKLFRLITGWMGQLRRGAIISYWGLHSRCARYLTLGWYRRWWIAVYWWAKGRARSTPSRTYWGLVRMKGHLYAVMVSFYWGLHAAANRAYWRLRSCVNRIYWLIYRAIYCAIIQIYWGLVRIQGRGVQFYWHAVPWFRSPVWTLRTRCFPVYIVTVFPFQKVYWFVSYQFKTRWHALANSATATIAQNGRQGGNDQ